MAKIVLLNLFSIRRIRVKRIFILWFFLVTQAVGAVFSPEEVSKLKANFLANIHPNGAIIASPSQHNPNYYYDWVRDSAIAMNLIESWYEENHSAANKERIFHYVSWTRMIQHQNDPLPGQDILGEPKFYINGSPFDGSWGRPQNDGPAIRAVALIRFAQQLLNQNEIEYVQTYLYNTGMKPRGMSVIKLDLEYIAHHWTDENFDLWEEVYGNHFFTTMVQQKALLDGAALARRMDDERAAIYYEQQARLMDYRLFQHLDQKNQLIQATIPPHLGPQKNMELDSAVILGILFNPQRGLLAPNSIYVEKTINALHKQFNQMFPINENNSGAILFGRYPGDTYDGYQTNSQGNPWFILTATMAEYYYALADMLSAKQNQNALMKKYIETGDAYLELVKKYAPDMNLAEQVNLNTGVQQGAKSLTWSYVSILHALESRNKVTAKLH
ncbi:glycoside hydrolase family 15 protein [Legionella sp.]|uniref:glycoside hydrolase family 15 protein n=1 Tax=Legionella sp. TaxID=459 RepID=UPI003D11D715